MKNYLLESMLSENPSGALAPLTEGNVSTTILTCGNVHYRRSSFEIFMGNIDLATSGNGTWLSQASDRDLIAELLADKRSENTRRAYQKDLSDFFRTIANSSPTPQLIGEFLGLDRFAAISLVLRYKAVLIEKKLKEATINRRLAAIKSLVNYARKIGKCNYSLEDVTGEKLQSYRDTSGIGADAFRKVLATCDRSTLKGKRDYAILHLLWSNALRRNEVATLDIKHLDPDARTLAILGKGRGSSRDNISLSYSSVTALLEWLNERRCPDPNAPLFCSVSRNKPGHRITGESIREMVDTACKKAGITKKMSPHRVRHGSITSALDKTGDVRKVQKLSRHRNIATLMIYDDNRSNMQGELTELLSGDID